MKIQYLGTAAAEGIPGMFCHCSACERALRSGGRNIMTRSQALIDGKLLIDFNGDTYMHFTRIGRSLYDIEDVLITHSHEDHFSFEFFLLRYERIAVGATVPRMRVWAEQGVIDRMWASVTARGWERERIERDFEFIPLEPFREYTIAGYTVTPLPAQHARPEVAYVYLIEKDGRALFYGNDTGFFPEEIDRYLLARGKHIDCLSLDCTKEQGDSDYYGHMSMLEGRAICDRFEREGLCGAETLRIYTHFSHSGREIYDDMVAPAAGYGFEVAYDGAEWEF